jgi:flagellar biosynthesis protein FlhG
MDQASTLRNLAAGREGPAPPAARPTHVFTISSGKGGVGKSNFVLNVAILLRRGRRKVLVMDADMGLGNIDILLGHVSEHNLSHVLTHGKTLDEIVARGPSDIHFLPASSGIEWMTNLTAEQRLDFLQKMDALNGRYDILLIDTGAGISSNVIYFNLAAQTRIVLVSPEPTSLTDAYALIKILNRTYQQKEFEIVASGVSSEKEGQEVYRNLTAAADRFLDVRLGYLGSVSQDAHLGQAVLRQEPVVDLFPQARISEDYRVLARRLSQIHADPRTSQLGLFWRRMAQSAAP